MFSSILMTIKEVSEILKISPALGYRLVTSGQLPGVRFGRTVRVREEDLREFVENNLTYTIQSETISKKPNSEIGG